MSRLVLHTESSVKRDARVLLPVAFSEDVLFPIRTTRHPLHLLLNGGALPGRCDTPNSVPSTNQRTSKQTTTKAKYLYIKCVTYECAVWQRTCFFCLLSAFLQFHDKYLCWVVVLFFHFNSWRCLFLQAGCLYMAFELNSRPSQSPEC